MSGVGGDERGLGGLCFIEKVLVSLFCCNGWILNKRELMLLYYYYYYYFILFLLV